MVAKKRGETHITTQRISEAGYRYWKFSTKKQFFDFTIRNLSLIILKSCSRESSSNLRGPMYRGFFSGDFFSRRYLGSKSATWDFS